MFSEPDDPTLVTRMRTVHAAASDILGTMPDPDGRPREAWGWRGRTLGKPVTGPYGRGWLRVVQAPSVEAGGKLWTGSEAAERTLPRAIPRPPLHRVREWVEGYGVCRAELYGRIDGGTLAPAPALTAAPQLTAAWWKELRKALDALTAVRTERVAVRQVYLDRAMPRYLSFVGVRVPTAPPAWSPAHGDLHWANLAGPDLGILDWEGWGLAPTGYDAALLHAYSLAVPETAARVRREFTGVLDSEAGRFAELVVITELLQSAERGDNPQLVPALRQRARRVFQRMSTERTAGC